jgi:hypothetical protein
VDIFFSYFITDYKETGETRLNTDDNSIIEFSTARHSGEIRNHVKRLSKSQMKILPIKLKKDDVDIKFETELPFFDSKYSTIQIGNRLVIIKHLIFKDKVNTFFIQTTTQPEPPTIDQANELAANFNATVSASEKYLYSFAGEKANGIIGYCADTQLSFLAYSTKKEPININCK